jgi:hypothetical protein
MPISLYIWITIYADRWKEMKEKISFIKWIFLKLQLIPKGIQRILRFLTTAEGEMVFGVCGGLVSVVALLPLIFVGNPLLILILSFLPFFLLLIGLHGIYRDEIEGDCWMGKVTVVLDDELEEKLRNHIKRKGDLSKIVNEALRKHLEEEEEKC